MRRALAVLLVLVMVGSVVSARGGSTSPDLKLPEELTTDELQELYKKYNITENDIKFARNELPYFLNGTLLGEKKVIVTPDGKLPEWLKEKLEKKGIKYDAVISKKEMLTIAEEAKERFKQKYGVDPDNPKVVIVDGVPLPKEYVKELVKKGLINPEGSDIADQHTLKHQIDDVRKVTSYTTTSTPLGPYKRDDGVILVYIFVAMDDNYGHGPDGTGWITETYNALDRFKSNFGVDMVDIWLYNRWDLSDISWDPLSGLSPADEALEDLKEDWGWYATEHYEIEFGWADQLDHNGIAYMNGYNDKTGEYIPYAVGSETGPTDWPDDSVVQHEISHLFNAPDRGTWSWEHPECIMNYWYAFWGTDKWCSDDWWIVYGNINGYWEE